MTCFQRIGLAVCRTVQSIKVVQPSGLRSFHSSNLRSFHSTSVRQEIAEFFPTCLREAYLGNKESGKEDVKTEDVKSEGFDAKFGRDWEISDLETMRNPTLHALWFVLLKERNAMLTADSFFRDSLKKRNPYRDRLKSVQQSMDNLKQVIEDREHTVAVVKHNTWFNHVSAHLGKDFADDLRRTYLQYNSPTCPIEKKGIEQLKRKQLFSSKHERYHQPYEMWDLKLRKEKRRRKEKTVVQYEHDIKKEDMDYKYYNPNLWKWERNIRERARRSIIKKNREKFRSKYIDESRSWEHPYRSVTKDTVHEDDFESLLK